MTALLVVCLHGRLTPRESLINANSFAPECKKCFISEPPGCSCGGQPVRDCSHMVPVIPGPRLSVKSYRLGSTYACFNQVNGYLMWSIGANAR